MNNIHRENERQSEIIKSLDEENKNKQKKIEVLKNIAMSLHSDSIIDEDDLSPNNKVREVIRGHNDTVMRTCFMFKISPCMYIISFNNKHKIGYTDDMNKILPVERRISPFLKIEYLVYAFQAYTLEQTMLLKYSSKLKSSNHKVLLDLTTDVLINNVREIIRLLNIEYEEEPKISEYNNFH